MPRASVSEENQALATTGWAYVSLHSTDPGTTGAGEIVGVTRVPVTWGAVANGAIANAGALSIALPANTTAAYFGIWDGPTAGVYKIGGALSPAVTSGSSAGNVTIAAGALSVAAA